jgi:hypothetical protein
MGSGLRTRFVRSAVVALSLLSLPLLTGCEVRTLQIQLPGYGEGSIDGIWLWKRISGTWTRVCRIDFTDHRVTQQGEELEYAQMCVNGVVTRGFKFPTPIIRAADSPSTITVELVYLRYEDAGNYKATAFNAFGESPLSSTYLPL